MSGLTVGLMSISALEVVILASMVISRLRSMFAIQSVLQNDPEGDPEAKKAAEVIARVT